MDPEEVIEFLGQVPLLQRLPSSSYGKIAHVVEVKHYESGEYVVREGEPVAGLCLIWDGEAEISDSSNADEGNRLLLRKYDYFGHGRTGSTHQVSVVALSALTCLILPNKYIYLLQPKSIWNADETPENFSLVEHILHLEPLDVNIFRGFTPPDAPAFRQVFGGQFIGQALAAASKTVDCFKLLHSLHATFILRGDNNVPIIYQVSRIRDGNNFATRLVEATQHGAVIFTIIASFQKEQLGFEHQTVSMPPVPSPETLLSMEELQERHMTDPRLPMDYRRRVASKKFVPWPIEIRFCERYSTREESRPSFSYWLRARGKLSDDPALHRCVVAYASDLIFAGVSLNPHRKGGIIASALSLDHSMWFHRPVKADDWVLFTIDSPTAYGGRGFVTGRMYNRKGELVVSLTQEARVREVKQSGESPKPRL
ncbi:acyl-coenzyme A thioesterase 8-like protein [Carex littledalei]|uniref:acyl-CoA hydrolase n=1 Tax=Carex littledalei TaxID=544730 RepID=A0A833R0Z3_9POAL|nr:acyl-coenzyme A thioesterase 8-like protein [Carex littledalei]